MGPHTSATLVATIASALAVAAPTAARAQDAPPPAVEPRTAISTNPLAIPFGVFTLDVETALRSPGVTFGAGGTWVTGGRDFRWADARLMYFPGEVALRGFAIGLTTGLVSRQGDAAGSSTCSPGDSCVGRRGATAPTLGVRVDYDWLVGARKRMLVGLGLGAKRVLRDVRTDSAIDQVYGDGRFVVGLVF